MHLSVLVVLDVIRGLSEIFLDGRERRSTSFIVAKKNTVYYIKTMVGNSGKISLKETRDESSVYDNVGRGYGIKTKLVIYKRGYREKDNVTVQDDVKTGLENTFFFTASEDGRFYISFSVEGMKTKNMELSCTIYNGEPGKPEITSNNDIEVTRAGSTVKRILDYIKMDMDMQTAEEDDDDRYQEDTKTISRKVLLIVILRMASAIIAMLYSGWKTKEFYSTQGAGDQGIDGTEMKMKQVQ
jgi:hypothetical protein